MSPAENVSSCRFATLSRLAPAVTHALRGAASTMTVHVELLSSSLDAEDDEAGLRERQRRWLTVLEDERRRLVSLAERFVSALRTPSDAPATIDLGALVTEVAALLTPYAVDARVRLETSVGDGRCAAATGCRDDLFDVLLACGVRVLDAAPRGSAVTIAVGPGDAGRRVVYLSLGAATHAHALRRVPRPPDEDVAALVERAAAAGGRLVCSASPDGSLGFALELVPAADSA